jgi:hypothetical protein
MIDDSPIKIKYQEVKYSQLRNIFPQRGEKMEWEKMREKKIKLSGPKAHRPARVCGALIC